MDWEEDNGVAGEWCLSRDSGGGHASPSSCWSDLTGNRPIYTIHDACNTHLVQRESDGNLGLIHLHFPASLHCGSEGLLYQQPK